MTDVLSILVEAVGARQAVTELQDVRDTVGEVRSSIEDAARTSAALATAAVAVSAVAIASANEAAAAASSLTAVAGEVAGARLAGEIAEITENTHIATSELTEFAKEWVAVGGEVGEVSSMLGSLVNAANSLNLNNSQFGALADVLTDIERVGVVRDSDIRRLIEANIPVNEIATSLGRGGVGDLAGMSKETFLPALLDEMNGLPAGTTNVINEAVMLFKDLKGALEPTGKILNEILAPLIGFLRWVVQILGHLNEFTRGWLGVIVIVGLLVAAMAVMIGAVVRATVAINAMSASAGAASVAQGAGIIAKVTGWLWWMGGMIRTVVIALNPLVLTILAVSAALAALAAIAVAFVEGISNIAQGKPFTDGFEDAVGRGVRWVRDRFDGDSPTSSGGMRPAEQPVRRNSIENVWSKANGRQMVI